MTQQRPMWKEEDQPFAELAAIAMAAEESSVRAGRLQKLWKPQFTDRYYKRAEANEIAPHIGHALKDAFGSDAPEPWVKAHDVVDQRIQQYMQVLDHVAELLASQQIPLIGLKNAGIARGIFPCLGCSPMGDLDVLVSKTDFRRAHKLLIEEGFTIKFRSPLEEDTLEAGEQGGGMEYLTHLPNGEDLWFELQWRPVSGRWIRPDQEPPAEELFERSIPIEGTHVRLLSPEDNLLQVCLHTAKHSYVRAPGLRLHTDVDRIVRFQTIDWETFIKRVIETGVKTACYFSLAIPKEFLGTPIPAEAINALQPSPRKERTMWRHIAHAGLLDPHETKFSNLDYIHFNASMYDDLSGLVRAILPDADWMKERYEFESNLALPYFHLKRLIGLAFRRTI